mgnify:CR=1 FL=1
MPQLRCGKLAGAAGIEPAITGPKPVALPLGHAPTAAHDIGNNPNPQHHMSGPTGRQYLRDNLSHLVAFQRLHDKCVDPHFLSFFRVHNLAIARAKDDR